MGRGRNANIPTSFPTSAHTYCGAQVWRQTRFGLIKHLVHMEAEYTKCTEENPPQKRPDAIALMFLTVGQIRNSDVWAAWLRSADPALFSIYVHAKVQTRGNSILFVVEKPLLTARRTFAESSGSRASTFLKTLDTNSENKMGRYQSC